MSRRYFKENSKAHRHNAFDAGAAWVSLSSQAHTMGLSVHAMAGYDNEAVYSILRVNKEKYEILAAIAIGIPRAVATREERTQRTLFKKFLGLI